MTDHDMTDLDRMFAQARARKTPVPDDLMARVLADADRAQVQQVTRVLPAPARGIWASLADLVGGWPVMGGLAAAGVAGVWLGFTPPAALETLAADLLGTTVSVDLWDDSAYATWGELTDG